DGNVGYPQVEVSNRPDTSSLPVIASLGGVSPQLLNFGACPLAGLCLFDPPTNRRLWIDSEPQPLGFVLLCSDSFLGANMKQIIIVGGLLALAAPAFAAEYYIVQNPKTKTCTITQERPASGGGLVIGAPFGVQVEAENRMKTVKECT